MPDVAELRVRLTADASGLKAGLVDVQAAVTRTASAFGGLRDAITPLNQAVELTKSVVAGITSLASGLANVFAAPIAAAAEQDKALAGLEATLKSSNQLTAEYAGNIGKLADAEALVKNVQDDVVLGAEKTLIAFGAQAAQLPKLVDAVLDLSTKTGDVAGAAFLVGKAIQGETTSLSRYGIFVDQAASATEQLDQALAQIQQRFGGQAAAAAATFSGRIGIVQIAFSQLQETLGAVITQNPVVLTAISGISQAFTRATEALKPFLPVIEETVSGLVALATVNVAAGLEGLADSFKDFPAVEAPIRAFASGLRDANTAALQAKANLKGVSDVVAQGARGAARFDGIFKEIGTTGRTVFRSVGAAIGEVTGLVGTLTDKLNKADLETKPLETIGNQFKASFQAALPVIEDALVTFALDVGKKIGSRLATAVAESLQNFNLAEALERKLKAGFTILFTPTVGPIPPLPTMPLPVVPQLQAGTTLDVPKATENSWLNFGKIVKDALTPTEAGAAEIPLNLIPPTALPTLPPPPPIDLTFNPLPFTVPLPDPVDLPINPAAYVVPAPDPVSLTINPLPFVVPPPAGVDLVITPRLGAIPPVEPIDLLVSPVLGPLPTIEPVELPVTPQLQALPALSAVEVAVVPDLQPLPALEPVSVDVVPLLGPLGTLAPLEIAVTPRLGVFPPLPAVNVAVTPQIAPLPPLAAIALPVSPQVGAIPPLESVDLPVRPVLGALGRLPALDVAVTPRLGTLPALGGLEVAVTPVLGPVLPLEPIDLEVTPVLGAIPTLAPVAVAVTPELGALPSLPALRVVVTPQLGSVPPLAAVSLPVEPKLGSLPALEPATLDVTPRVGAIEALAPVDLQVIPQLQPIPPLAPVDLIVNLRPGTTPPVQTVSAPLDFDPTRALATLGRVIGVAEADAAEIPTEFLPPPPITLPPIAAPQITLPEANLPPLALTADNTQALAVIDATQKDARTPLIATFDINPAAADASTQGFFSRLLSGMGDVAKKGAELLAATVKAPAELISKGFTAVGVPPPAPPPRAAVVPPSTFVGPPRAEDFAASISAAKQINAELEAQLATQKQITEQSQAQQALDAKRKPLAAAVADPQAAEEAKRFAEFIQLRKQFDEQNRGPLELHFTTTGVAEAATSAESIEARFKRLDGLEATPKAKLVIPPASEKAAADFEARITRLDGLTATAHATVSVTTGTGASLDDMLAKAHELDTFTPNLKVARAQSFEQSQSSVTALIGQYKALNDAPAPVLAPTFDSTAVNKGFETLEQRVARLDNPQLTATFTSDTSGLAPAEKAVSDLKKSAAAPIRMTFTASNATAVLSDVQKQEEETRKKTEAPIKLSISFSATDAKVKEQIGIINSDISSGIDPVTVKLEIDKAQANIDKMRANIQTLGDDKVEIQIRTKIADADQAKLDAFKKKAEEPAIKPVSADTAEGLKKVAELQAAAEAAVAAVAHGFGAIHGEAATSSDIQQTIDQLRTDLVEAIKAGDVAAQARLRGGGAQFIQQFSPGGGITAAERKQILDIIGPFASIGQAQLQQSFAAQGGFAGLDPAVASAMLGVATARQQDEANSLMRENNDVAKANLDATRGLAGALTSGRFVQGISQGVTRNQRSLQGNSNLRIGT